MPIKYALSRLATLLFLLFTSIGLSMSLARVAPAVAEASTPSVDVFVGYADTSRANATNFPTPWASSPNTTFAGCLPGCAYDAGAVRVVNNTGVAQTINSVVIHYSTCTYDIWPHDVPLPPGSQLIVTQTVGGADNGCTLTNGHYG